jgi:hypothetical protein
LVEGGESTDPAHARFFDELIDVIQYSEEGGVPEQSEDGSVPEQSEDGGVPEQSEEIGVPHRMLPMMNSFQVQPSSSTIETGNSSQVEQTGSYYEFSRSMRLRKTIIVNISTTFGDNLFLETNHGHNDSRDRVRPTQCKQNSCNVLIDYDEAYSCWHLEVVDRLQKEKHPGDIGEADQHPTLITPRYRGPSFSKKYEEHMLTLPVPPAEHVPAEHSVPFEGRRSSTASAAAPSTCSKTTLSSEKRFWEKLRALFKGCFGAR